jgi:hypothetical protein
VGRDVAAGEVLFDPLEELHVDGHEVFGFAVLRAFLHHPDLTVALDNFGFDLADLLMEQLGLFGLSAEEGFSGFLDASRAQRIRLPGPTEGRFCLLPGFQKRLFCPLGSERRSGFNPIKVLDRVKSDSSDRADGRIHVLRDPLTERGLEPVSRRIVGVGSFKRCLTQRGRQGCLLKILLKLVSEDALLRERKYDQTKNAA